MKTGKCECCKDLHYTGNLRAAPQAKRLGVGKKLCPPCREFLADVKDDDEYKWCVKHLDDDDHDREVPK